MSYCPNRSTTTVRIKKDTLEMIDSLLRDNKMGIDNRVDMITYIVENHGKMRQVAEVINKQVTIISGGNR